MRLLTGLRAWTAQRISAMLLLAFVLFFVARLVVAPPDGYDQWRTLVAQPLASIALTVCFGALLVHGWVGVRDVVLDYVHSRALRAAVLVAVGVGLAATGAAFLLALAALHRGSA